MPAPTFAYRSPPNAVAAVHMFIVHFAEEKMGNLSSFDRSFIFDRKFVGLLMVDVKSLVVMGLKHDRDVTKAEYWGLIEAILHFVGGKEVLLERMVNDIESGILGQILLLER